MKIRRRALARGAAAATAAFALLAAGAAEARKQPRPGPGGTWVERFLLEYRLPDVAPDAERFGPPEGEPPAMPLYRGDEIVGYAFDTWDVVEAVGFSRKPFHILAAIDLQGRLTGVSLAWHIEPIATLGRDDDDFRAYLDQFRGHDARQGVRVTFDGAARDGTATAGGRQIDGVSRVTTSSMLFADALLRSARLVARARDIDLSGPSGARARLDLERFDEMTWPELVADGSLSHRAISRGEIAAALDGAASAPDADPDAAEIEIWTALADPAGIGAHLLGRRGHGRYAVGRAVDDSAIFVATRGPRPVLPHADRGRGEGEATAFPALQVTQGAAVVRLTEDRFQPVAWFGGEGRPKDAAQGVFRISAADGFDPARPWRLELALFADAGAATGAAALFAVDYALPERYVLAPASVAAAPDGATVEPSTAELPDAAAGFAAALIDGPDWRAEWRAQRAPLIVLGATLAALFAILSLQEPLVRRPRLHLAVRVGFLAWTLGWVGWTAGAQLSVLHAINWIQSAEIGFDPGFFLMEPLIFTITIFVAVSALLWGRAAFCGWLCPFGALQELLGRLAAWLRLPQLALPEALTERLKALKYLIFVGLVALAFVAVDLANAASSVEPFKTAITFRFDAPWPAVAYALALLGVGLFVERFYCRFVCPLGAGLAVLGRLRMFDWLKRRAECGNPCRRCERVCPVGAIRPDGAIDMNECFYCLDCQVVYRDVHRCPPLVRRRKRREAAGEPATPGP